MAGKRVLLVGADPRYVELDPGRGRTAEGIRAAGEDASARLTGLGHEVVTCLVDPRQASAEVVAEVLSRGAFDCVMVGAGLRALVQYTGLFEAVMNVIHERAPGAKLCFNTQPGDTVEAVLRWI